MSIVKTIIRVPSQDTQYSVLTELTAAQVQTMYAEQIRGIGTMTAETVDSMGPSGMERTITFSPRAGNKG